LIKERPSTVKIIFIGIRLLFPFTISILIEIPLRNQDMTLKNRREDANKESSEGSSCELDFIGVSERIFYVMSWCLNHSILIEWCAIKIAHGQNIFFVVESRVKIRFY